MKRALFICLLLFFAVGFIANASGDNIAAELGLEDAEELIPDDLEGNFSATGTPSENGLSAASLFKTCASYALESVMSEIAFVFLILAVLVFLAVIFSFTDASHPTMSSAVRLTSSVTVSVILIEHIENAFSKAFEHISSLTDLMTGLLPFFGSVSLVGGEVTSSAVQKAVLLSAVNILQVFIAELALPICKIVFALIIAGYVSGVPLGALSELISSVATKIIALSCGIMCAILYFQNTVASVTDSLALRSVKLAAGSFIPIVGSFVSEASGTLISGVRLVKSTFGVFAICVLLYMSARPIIGFWIFKLSVRFSSVMAKLLGCDRESSVFSQVSSVYNILSAIMIASTCFFIFFVAVFLKSEVK